MNRTGTKDVRLSDEALQEMVAALGHAVRPRVLYRADAHEMTEEALAISQSSARAVLRLLREALPAEHSLALEIADLLQDGGEVWEHYPF